MANSWQSILQADTRARAVPGGRLTKLDRAKRKRDAILLAMQQRGHDGHELVKSYGCYDPFHVPLAACDECAVVPSQVDRVQCEPDRWRVSCQGCGETTDEARKYAWSAAIAWNSINLGSQHFADLPVFALHDLTPAEARNRLVTIRANLELRIALAHAERAVVKLDPDNNRKPPGRTYQHKLDAYLAWALLGLRLT